MAPREFAKVPDAAAGLANIAWLARSGISGRVRATGERFEAGLHAPADLVMVGEVRGKDAKPPKAGVF